MNKLTETVRLINTTGLSNRKIGKTVGVSRNQVSKIRSRLKSSSLSSVSVESMSDSEIEALLKISHIRVSDKIIPDWKWVHREMQYRGVTLILLWEEYCLANPDRAYSYSQFTYYYRQYLGRIDYVMRQTHLAGMSTFVDFAGQTMIWTDIESGEERHAQIFIAVMGCSRYTFAYAVKSQAIPSWIKAHNKMFAYFGGATEVIIPDNLKSAVTKAGAEPVLNRTYSEMARHYNTVILPARIEAPKDKALAELGVKLFYRWIMARLRHRKFFSIDEINQEIEKLLQQLNERPFQKIPGSRRSRFEEFDQPLLRALPKDLFEFAEWTALYKVGPDYHVRIRDHYYSVPHELISSRVEGRLTADVVEIYHRGKRVASHIRSNEAGGHTTDSRHQPKAHRMYANQKPELIIQWARSVGESSEEVVQHQFDSKPHALMAVRACSTLQRLAKTYGDDRFEAACKRAIQIGSLTPKSVRSILQHGLEVINAEERPVQVNLPLHHNVRGAGYYSNGGK